MSEQEQTHLFSPVDVLLRWYSGLSETDQLHLADAAFPIFQGPGMLEHGYSVCSPGQIEDFLRLLSTRGSVHAAPYLIALVAAIDLALAVRTPKYAHEARLEKIRDFIATAGAAGPGREEALEHFSEGLRRAPMEYAELLKRAAEWRLLKEGPLSTMSIAAWHNATLA